MARARIHESCLSLALGLGVCLAAGASHAQSSYSMTALGLGAAYQNQANPPNTAWIDSQDRVLSNMVYYEGKKLQAVWGAWSGSLLPVQFMWRDTFNTYPVRHAGTGTTLSASKLSSKSGMLQVVSPNGQRAYMMGANSLTAVPTGPAVPLDAGTLPMAMQDSGAYTGRINRPDLALPTDVVLSDYPAVWVPGQPRQDLPVPNGYRGGVGLALNARNEVAGAVFIPETMVPQAAVWRLGQLTMLDAGAGQASFATGISELGHVLVMSYAYTVQLTDSATHAYQVTRGAATHSVFYNGQRISLSCPTALPRALASAIGANGLVVGQCSVPGDTLSSTDFGPFTSQPFPPSQNLSQGRAWIWKDGVGTELATYLTARGVKLPSGMVLRHVLAVNAKGSMVVQTVNASGQLGLARFMALN